MATKRDDEYLVGDECLYKEGGVGNRIIQCRITGRSFSVDGKLELWLYTIKTLNPGLCPVRDPDTVFHVSKNINNAYGGMWHLSPVLPKQ